MDVKNVLKKTTKKSKMISIKISDDQREWMIENKYSPTGIFNEACKELGFEK